MKVSDIVEVLEAFAPRQWAQQWDNVGLIVGDASAGVKKLMLCIDLTSEVLAEAVRTRVSMVMAYHPVIFKGINRVTVDAAPVIYQAVRRGIAVYSMHTALDVAVGGTNDVLADAMGLAQTKPLEPLIINDQCIIVAFVPPDELSQVAQAAFAAGGGHVGNYYDCAFFSHGIGSFCPGPHSNPSVGKTGRQEMAEEMRLEVIAEKSRVQAVCEAIRSTHSYETPAINVYPLDDYPPGCGMGRVGQFDKPVTIAALITRIKKATGLKKLLIARAKNAKPIKIAACGAGSCGSMFKKAISAGATFYLTGEMRHHDLLAATAAGMTVVCLGHSNSERITLESLAQQLADPLDKIAITLSKYDKDPLEIA